MTVIAQDDHLTTGAWAAMGYVLWAFCVFLMEILQITAVHRCLMNLAN